MACDAPVVEKEVLRVVIEWIGIVLLVGMSGLFSGLTLGLMGLDKVGLEIIMGASKERIAGPGNGEAAKDAAIAARDAAYAKKIYPVRQSGNLLLCTLLIGNVMVNAALSILLAAYTDGTTGFLMSTVVIVIFGEITPQAVCSRHALFIGSRTVWLVKIFMALLYVAAKPISLALDWALGAEVGTIHSRSQLMQLLKIHVQHDALDEDSAHVMAGALDYKDKVVTSVMTPIGNVKMLCVNDILNFATVEDIFRSGYSRIPVHGPASMSDVVGLLLTKDLIVIDPEECTSVRAMVEFFGRRVHKVYEDTSLGEVLKDFKTGRGHLAVV